MTSAWLGLNYPEFPDSCRRVALTLLGFKCCSHSVDQAAASNQLLQTGICGHLLASRHATDPRTFQSAGLPFERCCHLSPKQSCRPAVQGSYLSRSSIILPQFRLCRGPQADWRGLNDNRIWPDQRGDFSRHLYVGKIISHLNRMLAYLAIFGADRNQGLVQDLHAAISIFRQRRKVTPFPRSSNV